MGADLDWRFAEESQSALGRTGAGLVLVCEVGDLS